MDATALDIRVAVPDDAIELASTTRLGFESYLAWAPEGWQPPPRSLEIRAIRERLRAKTTWCAMAIEPEGEQAGHVGITHASRARAPARARSRAARTCGCCSCGRRGGAPGWRRACTGSRSRRRRARGTRRSGSTRRTARRGRARSTSARAGSRRARVSGAAAGAGPRRVSSSAVIPEGMFEDAASRSRVSMPRAGSACGRAGASCCRPRWPSRRRGRSRSGAGARRAVLRARRGDHRARAELLRARAARGRSSCSRSRSA